MSNYYKSGSLGLIDAVSQSFTVDTIGGEFLTSVELYFQTKDANLPITVHLRTMNQGIPTSTVLPFSEVTLPPSSVNITTYDDTGTPSNSTKFTFETPVYIESDTEYAICVMSNSKDYNLYVSEIGQERLGTNTRITTQPSSGVFFTSQNASTWLPSPNRDLSYKLNRAKFNVDSVGVVNLQAVPDSPTSMKNDPFRVETDTPPGNVNVIVTHRNHCLANGDTVYLTNDSWTATGTAISNGITLGTIQEGTTINGDTVYYIEATVSSTSFTEFTLVGTSDSASSAGTFGANNWSIYTNKNFNYIFPTIETLNFSSTAIEFESKVKNGIELGVTGGSRSLESIYKPIETDTENYFTSVKTVENDPFRTKSNGDFLIRANLYSANQYQSPVIDLDRCSTVLIHNLVNNDDTTAETTPYSGSNISKYTTREVVLNDPATSLRLYCDVNAPSIGNTDIEFYYKTGSSEQDFSLVNWVQFDPDVAITPVSNSSDPNDYSEVEYLFEGTGSFEKYCIKIVMKSSKSSYVPTCKNLRVVAYT